MLEIYTSQQELQFQHGCLVHLQNKKHQIKLGKQHDALWYSAGKISKKGHPHHPLYLRKDGVDYDNLYATSFVFEKDADGNVTNVAVEKGTVSYYELSRSPNFLDKYTIRSKKPIAVKKK